MAVAYRALGQVGCSVFVTAVHATVAVVVHRAISDVVLIHKIHDGGYGFRIMRCVAVYFDIEDMAASCECVIWSLDFRFVAGAAVVVDRHMVGVGIIDLVCYAGQYSESLAVFGSKLARQSLGGSRQNGIVMLIFLAEIIDAAAHVSHDFKTESSFSP